MMKTVHECLEQKDTPNVLLEMPTGSGKTAALLSILLAHLAKDDRKVQMVYATRTHAQVKNVVNEMRKFDDFIRANITMEKNSPLCISLAGRHRYCIHPNKPEQKQGDNIDYHCNAMIAPWLVNKCDFFQSVLSCYNDYSVLQIPQF